MKADVDDDEQITRLTRNRRKNTDITLSNIVSFYIHSLNKKNYTLGPGNSKYNRSYSLYLSHWLLLKGERW